MPARIPPLRALLDAVGGRAFTFGADFAATVLGLLLAQSYAARQAAAGELRWYLAAALLVGAIAAQCVLAPLFCRLRSAALQVVRRPVRLLRQKLRALQGKAARRNEEKIRAKTRSTVRKNMKKQLQNTHRVLYNSNVS